MSKVFSLRIMSSTFFNSSCIDIVDLTELAAVAAIINRGLFPLDGAGLKCLFHNGGPNPAGCQTEFFRAAPNSKQPIKMAVFCFGPAFIFDTN